ncbi:MAG: Flp pilus assembly protein CpaB, partial [Bacillota bacterium]
MNQVKQAYRTSGQFKPVVVAVTDIPARTAITDPMVRLKEMPAEFVHPDAVADKKDVIGKITAVKILAGEPVLRGRLLQEEEKGRETLAARVPVGRRAIAVAIDCVS